MFHLEPLRTDATDVAAAWRSIVEAPEKIGDVRDAEVSATMLDARRSDRLKRPRSSFPCYVRWSTQNQHEIQWTLPPGNQRSVKYGS